MSPLPKASGGLNPASTPSMGIVFPLPTMARSTVGALSPPLLPLLFSSAQTLLGLSGGGTPGEKGTCLHVRFTHIQREEREKKNQIAQTRTRTRTRVSCLHAGTCTRHLIQRGTTMETCEKKENGETSGRWRIKTPVTGYSPDDLRKEN